MHDFQDGLQILVLLVSLGAIVFQAGSSHARGKATAQNVVELKETVQGLVEKCDSCRGELDHEDKELHGRVTNLAERVARTETAVSKGRV